MCAEAVAKISRIKPKRFHMLGALRFVAFVQTLESEFVDVKIMCRWQAGSVGGRVRKYITRPKPGNKRRPVIEFCEFKFADELFNAGVQVELPAVDNGNVHRAAANIIVSKSHAARGSVCNVLLSWHTCHAFNVGTRVFALRACR